MPSRREPIFRIPIVVVAIIAICAAIQIARSFTTGTDTDLEIVARFAFVPARLTAWLDPSAVAARLTDWLASGDRETLRDVSALRFFLSQGTPPVLTLLSYAFLHGDWTHLGFNSLWLLAFGTPVARRFGTVRFLALMLVAAVAGALTHWACYPFGVDPVIGASASVSGCMGAALRFIFDPAGRADAEAGHRPVQPLRALLRNRGALSFLIVWFGSNALFGIGSMSFGLTQAPVAWQAHIGGFLAGVLLFRLFDPKPPISEPLPEPLPSGVPEV